MESLITESINLEMTKIKPKKYISPIIEEEKEKRLREELKNIRRSKSYERESSGYGYFIFNGGFDEQSLQINGSLRHLIKENLVYLANSMNI